MAGTDRRSPAADDLAKTLLNREEPVPFDDLVERGDVADVAGWVGNAVDEGLIEDVAANDGRRRFKLRRRGQRVLSLGRRATDR